MIYVIIIIIQLSFIRRYYQTKVKFVRYTFILLFYYLKKYTFKT